MATTSSVSGASAANSTTTAASARLSNNFDTFLQLLTTQLRNQDPTQPMDANQFTQQLVQYSQVEQQLATNSKLDNLLAAYQTNQTTAALGYLGRKVSYDASTVTPTSTGATWTFTPPSQGTYTLRIRDSAGVLVGEKTMAMEAGAATSFTWDGKRSDGATIGSEPYTLELLAGTGSTASQVAVIHKGEVTAVDTSSGTVRVTVGTNNIPVQRITGITL